jgi:SAM-dependent methyltransferase
MEDVLIIEKNTVDASSCTITVMIHYGRSDDVFLNYGPLLEEMIQRYPVRTLLEVGGGANPSFSLEQIHKKGWNYTLLDVAEAELAKAPAGYPKIHADISSPRLAINQKFDFIFSKMLIEHVRDAEQTHRNIYNLLAPGGVAFHFFPTLYALPYIANWLVPEWISGTVLRLAHPERHAQGNRGKFPAYYRWCFGPTRKQIGKFERLGYTVDDYAGLYGHSYYYEKIPLVRNWHAWLTSFWLKHPNPWLTSYAYVILRKAA